MWDLSSSALPLLGPHLPLLLFSAAFFWAVQIGTHIFAPRWPKSLPGNVAEKWKDMDTRTKKGFASHVVSQVHALIAIPLAVKSIQSAILAEDPVFGYDSFVGDALAISAGYFIWDTIDSLLNSTIGFVVHGAACLSVYLFSFRPFLAGFGPCFLLWELSTPFLNTHWFMDKLDLYTAYPTVFLVNSIAFMGVFFLARIVYGGYNSFVFFGTMWRERHRIPWYLHLIYCSGNVALNALNWLWFSKMLAKLVARLSGEEVPKGGAGVGANSGGRSGKLRPGQKRRSSSVAPAAVTKTASEAAPLLDKEVERDSEEEGSIALPAKPPKPVVQGGKKVDL